MIQCRRRLEKRIYIPLPNYESRKELIRINLKTVEVNLPNYSIHAVDAFFVLEVGYAYIYIYNFDFLHIVIYIVYFHCIKCRHQKSLLS